MKLRARKLLAKARARMIRLLLRKGWADNYLDLEQKILEAEKGLEKAIRACEKAGAKVVQGRGVNIVGRRVIC